MSVRHSSSCCLHWRYSFSHISDIAFADVIAEEDDDDEEEEDGAEEGIDEEEEQEEEEEEEEDEDDDDDDKKEDARPTNNRVQVQAQAQTQRVQRAAMKKTFLQKKTSVIQLL